ncbi:peptide chain release factor N(5)-glutamine methyltransferase [Desulfonatronovibrio magnus]|uniref:peptide chain release factor N(5)-glutamine methyltransferase n=1 Tax=Desulfonatronovibrio magnus TaxID=698827 RepID=UPI000697EBB9|nr:peptide chain release factor N(5)-glutamine methyltransferase [Desulfonatronovibrio magnus]RQD56262.1 MAG: peptide chain release factor N(5)-glutamine methyltransferase [Desulfonatronovibrio sp. MSAO_Bac4]
MAGNTTADLLNKTAAILNKAEVDSPRLSARLLLAHAMGCSQEYLFTHPDHIPSPEQTELFLTLIERRKVREPVAYITGHKEFYGLPFLISKDVLTPRPETELIVDLVQQFYSTRTPLLFADLGTGSGILAAAITAMMPQSRCLACDISFRALQTAAANFSNLKLKDTILSLQSDMGQGIKENSLDFIVSNPPYISEKEYLETSREVVDYEPRIALVSHDAGMGHIKLVEARARNLLKKNGMVFMEMGSNQTHQVKDIFSTWKSFMVHQDLAGLDRIITAKMRT